MALPLVGIEMYTLFGCLSRPWVTFSFGPTETGLGYIVKWLDRGLSCGKDGKSDMSGHGRRIDNGLYVPYSRSCRLSGCNRNPEPD